MIKTEQFVHQGVTYEIRSAPFEDAWRAAVFLNNKRISPNYSVSHEDDLNCAFYAGERGLDSLFRLIKSDIVNGFIP